MIARVRGPLTVFAGRLAAVILLIAALALLVTGQARAEERILAYDADIAIAADGVVNVTETIKVNAEGRQIRRGIFRDFPLLFDDGTGKTHKVGFEVVSVTRSGEAEPWFVERSGKIARVYIGDKDKTLWAGEYTYVIRYTTDRQIRFFSGYDELFWNVTGNAWTFPIDKASATVTLPEGGRIDETVFFTGPFGSKNKNATVSVSADRRSAAFSTTVPLRSREGLTVGVKFAKGLVAAPSQQQELDWWLRDNKSLFALGAGLLALISYYMAGWWRVGRDPAAGVIVPRWDAPDGVSPALANYIDRKGLSGQGWDAIAAAILSLAVKGHLVIEDVKGDVKLVRRDVDKRVVLPVGERAILSQLGSNSGVLELSKHYGEAVKKMNERFRTAMESEHRSKYYLANWPWIIGGFVLSVICIAVMLLFSDLAEDDVGGLIAVTFFGSIVLFIALPVLRNFGSGLAGKFRSVFMGAAALYILASAFFRIFSGGTDGSVFFAVMGILAILMVNIIFFFLMGAPTPLGRSMMDGLEGMKTYIKLAESDRLNLAGAPEMSPAHYEKILPYAVALRLEKPWTKAFQNWMMAAAAAGAAGAAYAYGPDWYSGRSFSPDQLGKSMDSLTSDLESSMAAAMPAPKSSDSGFSSSGGFSGGGGGGGGGW